MTGFRAAKYEIIVPEYAGMKKRAKNRKKKQATRKAAIFFLGQPSEILMK